MGKPKQQEKQEVIKHSAAIQIENTISLLQRLTWNALLYNAYNELNTAEEHRITLKELASLVGYNSHDMDYLKEAARAMLRCIVEWDVLDKDGSPEWGATALLAQMKINRGVCFYAYSPELRRRLHNPAMYARLDLHLQRQFTSKYALTLWELCADYLGSGRAYGETPFIPVANFRKIMGVDKQGYPKFKEFNRCVIKEPLEEINAVSDFRISVDYQRESRKVTAVKFKMHRVAFLPGPAATQETLFPELEEVPLMVRELQAVGLAPHEARDIWQQGFDYVHEAVRPQLPDTDVGVAFLQYIREKIHLLKRRQAASKVDNSTGFLLQAIRENYANPEFKQEQQQRMIAEAQETQQARKKHDRVLAQHQATLEKAREEEMQQLYQQVADERPDLLEAALPGLLQENFFFKMTYDQDKSVQENYRSRPLLQMSFHPYLERHVPERFAAVRERYEAQLATLSSTATPAVAKVPTSPPRSNASC